jgi:hypothetical protein
MCTENVRTMDFDRRWCRRFRMFQTNKWNARKARGNTVSQVVNHVVRTLHDLAADPTRRVRLIEYTEYAL